MKKREKAMVVILAGLLGTTGVFLGLRLSANEGALDRILAEDEADEASGEEAEDADSDPVATTDESSAAPDGGGATPDAPAEEEPTTLRVVGLGSDSLAPGILANRGRSPGEESRFSALGLHAHFRGTDDVTVVEHALALGGDDEQGAHLIVLPLPTFVAGYERLRALEPRIVGVAAWSAGRDALYAPERDVLVQRRRGEVTVCGSASSPAAFFALYLMELAGYALDDTRVGTCQGTQQWAAVDRTGEAPSSRLVATTADASTLIPWVMVVPEAMLADTEDTTLARFLEGWFAGVSDLRADVPAAARAVAEGGSPVQLLQRLGQIEIADLAQNAEAFGLSGRGAVTVGALFEETWRVWRATGVLATPAPTSPPLDVRVVAAAVRVAPARPEPPSRAAASFETEPLLSLRTQGLERADLIHRTGWIAGLFPRAGIELRQSLDERRRNALVDEVRSRFGLSEDRVRAVRSRRGELRVYSVR